jgi:hypothetical protein
VHVTKKMLGIQTRKSILYLDQNVFSSAYRGNDPQWVTAMERITELRNLQLVAVPYSSIHEAEADFYAHRDALLKFIQDVSRGHQFESYYRVEQTQILKAFQAYLVNAPVSYIREECDAVPLSVHDWDGPYSVSVFRGASNVEHKREFKQQDIDELVNTLRSNWATSKNTFEQDMELEFRILSESYEKADWWCRLFGDVLSAKKMCADAARVIPLFFRSKHFAEVPSVQLPARLFSAFRKRVREGAYPNPGRARTREKLSGFLFDVQHAATYAPYCDAFFTDRFMADLLNDSHVAVEQTFGCKVFSVSKRGEFFSWLEGVKSGMTADHADGLKWAYPKYRSKGIEH